MIAVRYLGDTLPIAGLIVIFLGASAFIVETLPPRMIVMVLVLKAAPTMSLVYVIGIFWRNQVSRCSCGQQLAVWKIWRF